MKDNASVVPIDRGLVRRLALEAATKPKPKPRRETRVKTIEVASIKAVIPFRAGQLPAIDPADPTFELELAGFKIQGQISAKSARKLAIWQGGAVLQGRLVSEGGRFGPA